MVVLDSVRAARAFAAGTHAARQRLVLVPTMGALHVGHQALIRAAAQHADIVMVSIFVNPTQFGPGEDLDRYPRDPEGDLAKAKAAGAHAVFMPTVEAIYPLGAVTRVHCDPLADRLCGASRPGHFTGVCTIVLKLFNITRCDAAVFGEKDFQQLAILRRMVRDLDVPVEVVGHPIVREADGLAMSSRNVYLSPGDRIAARSLNAGLDAAAHLWASGESDSDALLQVVRDTLSGGVVDYLEARDPDDLEPVSGVVAGPLLIALAVRFGSTRLIDNRVLRRLR